MAASLETAYPDVNANITVDVSTLRDRTVGDVRFALLVLLAAVAMVLLIACANVANLVLVRGAARQSELAVRTALGAGRRGLVWYLLTENLLLAVAGGCAGLVVAAWGVDLLRSLAPADLPRLDEIPVRRSGVRLRARARCPHHAALRPRTVAAPVTRSSGADPRPARDGRP